VAPLPRVDFPTISISASLPGASPQTMAQAVATPLERRFGRIAGLTEMTSVNTLGSTSITLQFDLDRDITGAARDVQAAINASLAELPPNLPSLPNYRKVNPADSPILILSLTSQTLPLAQVFDAANSVLAQKISQIDGVGQVIIGGCRITDGKIVRSSQVRVQRGGQTVFTGLIESIRRGKDDVREVAQGYECGLILEDYNALEVGDIVEAFSKVRV